MSDLPENIDNPEQPVSTPESSMNELECNSIKFAVVPGKSCPQSREKFPRRSYLLASWLLEQWRNSKKSEPDPEG